ncbi:DegT/DnrJ/EryC1/StrS family aminotransferase [Candidatus Gracilibacteria bacterium]|nr:DegT/DnrJ/EryC1/StrS family aminotransferase [Candidatus Gracilibacteria bacterium]
MSRVKFLDLKAQYPLIKDEIMRKFDDILDRTGFVSGKYVTEFEKKFAEYVGVKHAIACTSGTTALYLPLLAKGIGPGDEVIMPVNTFIATAEAVSLLGAKPVFVDIDEATCNMDVEKIEAAITDKTVGIIPVHLYGQCVDMDRVSEIADKAGLWVIEDACQAHGAAYRGRNAGSMSDAAAFSFYPGKNLGSWGEGGAVVTDNDELAEKMRLLVGHGSIKKYYHKVVGGNFRMTEFQGAVLDTKIEFLEQWNEGRRKNAHLYMQELANVEGLRLPHVEEFNKPVWHLFVVRVGNREAFMDALKEREIDCGIHYPFPLHLCEAYAHLGYKEGDFPVAEKVQKEIVSLPMYAELSRDDIVRVGECVREILVESSVATVSQ